MALKSQAELHQILHIKVMRLLVREFIFATEPTRELLFWGSWDRGNVKEQETSTQHTDDQDSPSHQESTVVLVEEMQSSFR